MIRWKKRYRSKDNDAGMRVLFAHTSRRPCAWVWKKKRHQWCCTVALQWRRSLSWMRAPSMEEAMRWCEKMRTTGGRELIRLPTVVFTREGEEAVEVPMYARAYVFRRWDQPPSFFSRDERGVPEMVPQTEVICEARKYAVSWTLPEIGEYVDVVAVAFAEPGMEDRMNYEIIFRLNQMKDAAKQRAFEANMSS